MNLGRPRLISFAVLLTLAVAATEATAQDLLKLKNTHERAANFELYSTESGVWISSDGYVASQGLLSALLESEKPHYLQFYVNGYRQPVGTFDFHSILKRSPGKAISLNILYKTEERKRTVSVTKTRTETKTRMVPVTRMSTESKTRQVPVTKMRLELKTKNVTKVNPETGKKYTVQVQYTVQVPYTEIVAQHYTVQVPYTQMIEQHYTVQVPYTENVVQKYTVQVPKYSLQIDGQAALQPIKLGGVPDVDQRTRFFGATFRNGQNGVVVTSVKANSPASKFTRIDVPSDRPFVFSLEQDTITHINGRKINTVEDAEKAIQDSHFIMEFRVRESLQNRTGTYRAQLRLFQN